MAFDARWRRSQKLKNIINYVNDYLLNDSVASVNVRAVFYI